MPRKIEFMCKHNSEIVCKIPYRCWDCEQKDYILKGLEEKVQKCKDKVVKD